MLSTRPSQNLMKFYGYESDKSINLCSNRGCSVDYENYVPTIHIELPEASDALDLADKTRTPEEHRKLYFLIQEEMDRLADVEGQFAVVYNETRDTEESVVSATKRLSEASEAVAQAKDFKGKGGYSGWSKLFQWKSYREAKRDAAAERQKAKRKVDNISIRLAGYQQTLEEHNDELNRLQRMKRQRKLLDMRRKKILDELFAGYVNGDGRENEAERKRDSARAEKRVVCRALVDQIEALDCLRRASLNAESIIRLLESASLATLYLSDMQSGIPYEEEILSEKESAYNIEKVKSLGKRVNKDLEDARRISAKLPLGDGVTVKVREPIPMPTLSTPTRSVRERRASIKEELDNMIEVYRNVRAAQKWQERLVIRIKRDLDEAEAKFVEAGNELVNERVRLIQELGPA